MQDQDRRHEFHRVACGLGARRSAVPARCPVCGGGDWKPIAAPQHTLSQTYLLTRPVEVAATQ